MGNERTCKYCKYNSYPVTNPNKCYNCFKYFFLYELKDNFTPKEVKEENKIRDD